MDDLDEAIALAQGMPYPVAELKALALYGHLYTATGECAKAREASASALAICERFDENLYQFDIGRSLVALPRG
jgi:hypothetical protein